MTRSATILNGILIGLSALLANGCGGVPPAQQQPRTVTYSTEVANVFVTALPAMAFSDIQASLAISHGLAAADCRLLASQTTGSSVFQLLSQIALGASLSLPLRTANNSTTTTNGVPSSTNTAVTGSATTPSSSGAPTNSASGLAPDLTKPATSYGLDGEAQVLGGTGICQTAALAQQQIASARLPDGYDASVITFQVNVQPKARDLSYDTDIDVQLWPTNSKADGSGVSVGAWETPPIMVKPLIINDVLESTSVARSVQAVRQFAASISGVLPSLAALNVGGGVSKNDLNEAFGADRNAVLTMGAPSNNTIRIHLGAPSSGTYKYAIVPRTFNVSTLVLTRKDQGNILFVSHSAFTSTDPTVTIQPITTTDREYLAALVKTQLCHYPEFSLSPEPMCGGMALNCSADSMNSATKQYALSGGESAGPFLDILRQTGRQNRAFLDACIVPRSVSVSCNFPDATQNNACLNSRGIANEISRLRLYSELATVNIESRYSSSVISLPVTKITRYPFENQLVAVVDDGTLTTLVLSGGANMSAINTKDLTAFATIVAPPACAQASPCVMSATTLTPSADGSSLTLAFPSLSKLKIADAGVKTVTLDSKPDAVAVHLTCADIARKGDAKAPVCFSNFVAAPIAKAGADAKAAAKVTATVTANETEIVADSAGNGIADLTINVDKIVTADKALTDPKAKPQMPVLLSVSGGPSVPTTNAASAVLSFGPKNISVLASGTGSLPLRNLHKGQTLTITVMDSAGKTALSTPLKIKVVQN